MGERTLRSTLPRTAALVVLALFVLHVAVVFGSATLPGSHVRVLPPSEWGFGTTREHATTTSGRVADNQVHHRGWFCVNETTAHLTRGQAQVLQRAPTSGPRP